MKKTKYKQAIDDKGLIAAVKRPVFKHAVTRQGSYEIFEQIFQDKIFSIQNLYTAQIEGKKSLFSIKRTYTETWHRIKSVAIRKTIFLNIPTKMRRMRTKSQFSLKYSK